MNSLKQKRGNSEEATGKKIGEKMKVSRKLIAALILCVALLACAGSIAVVEIWPSFGAQMANWSRNIMGPQAVARVEAVIFRVHDAVK